LAFSRHRRIHYTSVFYHFSPSLFNILPLSWREGFCFLKNALPLVEYVTVLNSQTCSLSTDAFKTVLAGKQKTFLGKGKDIKFKGPKKS
ncbi:MAG: hypothetical protein IKY53_03715, partial [Lachnospiraceae bacterium]|nr:hypothetical protein [Lachnospiraceae bacterium]